MPGSRPSIVDVAVEYVLRLMGSRWVRGYLALGVFGFFRESNYMAFPYMLREAALRAGIGRSTLYKGLGVLLSEGIAEKRGQLYVLTQRGRRVLELCRGVEESARLAAASGDLRSLRSLLEEVERFEATADFEANAKVYLANLVSFLIASLAEDNS